MAKMLGVDQRKRIFHASGDFSLIHPEIAQAKGDIAVDIGIKDLLIGILKYGCHLLAQRQQAALAVVQRLALPQHRALLRAQKPAEIHKQRRFPAAVGPNEAGDGLAREVQRQPFKRRFLLVAKPEVSGSQHGVP